jgi:hypothetical protein
VAPIVRTGPAAGFITQQRIPLTASDGYPTPNVRTGVLALPLVIASGGNANAADGEIYSMAACISHVANETSDSTFIFTGTRLP